MPSSMTSKKRQSPPAITTVAETTQDFDPPNRFVSLVRKLQPTSPVGWIVLIIVFLIVASLIFASIGAVYSYFVMQSLNPKIASLETSSRAAYDSLKTQDLGATKTHLLETQTHIQSARADYQKISFWRYTPLSWHYHDGIRVFESASAGVDAALILVNAVEPYADVIGFQGQGSFVGGTAEDRIVKIIETLDKVTPSLDEVIAKLEYIDLQIEGIHPGRYPFKFRDQPVGDLITKAKTTVSQATDVITQIKPIIQVLPSVAGVNEPKRYLVLFQNDGELRPTGGFLTAYAILQTEKGKVSPERSDDIYDLDAKFNTRVPPPSLLGKYLKQSRWNLRDMNTNPDFKLSMDQFMGYYQDIPGEPKVDGVVALDTQVLADLLTALGPVEVPGYGIFSPEIDARCDCPQVIYLLEDISTRPTPYFRSERKAVLGPLMQTILFKAYGAPKQVWPQLFQTIWDSINDKHVLFYFYDEAAQQAVEANNLAGRIKPFDADYLHINDANLGGAKSNMFVTQAVEHDITIEPDKIKRTLSITYKNPQKGSNCNLEAGQLCLNGVMPSWIRVYVPKGSTLESVQGIDEEYQNTYEELDKTVFEGMYTIAPESQTKVVFTYTVPLTVATEYQILVQKQPGTKDPLHTFTINGSYHDPINLSTDKELTFPL